MPLNFYDFVYSIGLCISAPYWLAKPGARHKVLSALRDRMGPDQAMGAPPGPAILIHAVSNGELGAASSLVRMLGELRPELHFIISTTTATGFERGAELYASDPRVQRIRYPLDFGAAVRRTLDRLRPQAVVLMELEVWPNFIRECARRGIAVVVANGRMTRESYRGYRLLGLLARGMFRKLAFVGAQEKLYADRFIQLGAVPSRVQVLGTMKFDSASVGDRVEGDDELARALGLDRNDGPILVCGSTGAGEETEILQVYRSLLATHPLLRLVLVPRHRTRFEEVARLIIGGGFPLVRRSQETVPSAARPRPVILGDTMGELRRFYSLATLVFVGRSLVDLGPRQHGSDMIEPAALGKPIVIGPFTQNFTEPMNRFIEADAIRVVHNRSELQAAADELLTHAQLAAEMGRRAREVVRRQRGATRRHVEVLLKLLDAASHASHVAASPPAQS